MENTYIISVKYMKFKMVNVVVNMKVSFGVLSVLIKNFVLNMIMKDIMVLEVIMINVINNHKIFVKFVELQKI